MPGLPTVEDALALVLARVPEPEVETVALEDSGGRVLAEDVLADGDFPPFDRSKIDGYAVRAADVAAEGAELRVFVRIAAGAAPGASILPLTAARILTGAPVPQGADALAMQERCTVSADGASVRVPPGAASADYIVPQGSERRAGELVAAAGSTISPGLVGVLASVGTSDVRVHRRPTVRIVASGSELVPHSESPGPGRIRNSNAPALAAAARAIGCRVLGSAAAVDDADVLRTALDEALSADVVLVTGGVSVGDLDLVPPVLASLGVAQVLHGVRLQPGKPVWFGVRGRTLIFALPGNPVSALVNMVLFVRPAVFRLLGRDDAPGAVPAVLGGPLESGTWRRKYVPVTVRREEGELLASPVPYQGSGDVFGFSEANALAIVPEQSPARAAGAAVHVLPLFEALP